MQQVNSPLLNESLTSYKNFLHSINLEDREIQEASILPKYHSNMTDSAFIVRDFTWEFFSNELEFE